MAIERAENLPYTEPKRNGIAAQILDIYRPVTAADSTLPTVILLHGAGSGKDDIQDWALDAAGQQLLVYAANWPVPPLTSFNSNSEKRLRESNEAIGCLIQFAQATAAQFGGSTDRLVLAGFSAGALQGSISTLNGPDWQAKWQNWATTHGGPGTQHDCLYEVQSDSWVKAFVGVGGPYGLFAQVLGDPTGLSSRERGLYELLAPSALLETANRELAIRIVHGRGDSVVRESYASSFALAAERAGFDTSYTLVDGAGHTTINAITVPIIYDLATRD